MVLEFNEEETKKIGTIAKYYDVVKELLIFGEQIDPENNTLTQPINEIRNCFDHLSRVILYKLGIRTVDDAKDYSLSNLDKSFGHIYRAAYDTLDWVALTLKERIITELDGISLEAISHVFPSYYSELKPRFEKIMNEEVAKLRMEKDVTTANEENLVQYGKLSKELEELFQKVVESKPAMIEYNKKRKKQVWLGYIISFIIGGGLITIIYCLLDAFVFND